MDDGRWMMGGFKERVEISYSGGFYSPICNASGKGPFGYVSYNSFSFYQKKTQIQIFYSNITFKLKTQTQNFCLVNLF